ncbi:MAG: hypothetical protein H7251_02910 [Acetobacteraceae bacterium]|nr:hypothetical protein [Acetobacteraceae bacterium]
MAPIDASALDRDLKIGLIDHNGLKNGKAFFLEHKRNTLPSIPATLPR